MHFELDESQLEKLAKWRTEVEAKADTKVDAMMLSPTAKHNLRQYGAIVGTLTYSFTPTSLGTIVVVTEAITGEAINLTDYNSW